MLASVLVFMYGVKNYLLANFWILLGVMLETGIDCAKIAPLTIKVAMSMFFVSVLYKMLFQMIPKLSKYLKGTMLKNAWMEISKCLNSSGKRIFRSYGSVHMCNYNSGCDR